MILSLAGSKCTRWAFAERQAHGLPGLAVVFAQPQARARRVLRSTSCRSSPCAPGARYAPKCSGPRLASRVQVLPPSVVRHRPAWSARASHAPTYTMRLSSGSTVKSLGQNNGRLCVIDASSQCSGAVGRAVQPGARLRELPLLVLHGGDQDEERPVAMELQAGRRAYRPGSPDPGWPVSRSCRRRSICRPHG